MLSKRNLSQSTCADSPNLPLKKINAPDVDAKICGHSSYEVCKSSNGDYLSTYLMNSDCGKNNNKFYILQLLKLKNSKNDKCWLHTRYGRVGDPGVQGMALNMNPEAGEKAYLKTFKQKTSKAKGYTPIEMKMGAEKDSNIKVEITKTDSDVYPKSKLEKPVQDLINFIFDKKLMEQSVTSVGYDPSKLPLGEWSAGNVNLGYQHLRAIEELLLKVKDNNASQASVSPQLTSLSSAFYTQIPHNFGRQKMSLFIIDSLDKLKQKMDLVKSLNDIKTALNMKKKNTRSNSKGQTMKTIEKTNPIDD